MTWLQGGMDTTEIITDQEPCFAIPFKDVCSFCHGFLEGTQGRSVAWQAESLALIQIWHLLMQSSIITSGPADGSLVACTQKWLDDTHKHFGNLIQPVEE